MIFAFGFDADLAGRHVLQLELAFRIGGHPTALAKHQARAPRRYRSHLAAANRLAGGVDELPLDARVAGQHQHQVTRTLAHFGFVRRAVPGGARAHRHRVALDSPQLELTVLVGLHGLAGRQRTELHAVADVARAKRPHGGTRDRRTQIIGHAPPDRRTGLEREHHVVAVGAHGELHRFGLRQMARRRRRQLIHTATQPRKGEATIVAGARLVAREARDAAAATRGQTQLDLGQRPPATVAYQPGQHRSAGQRQVTEIAIRLGGHDRNRFAHRGGKDPVITGQGQVPGLAGPPP